MTGDWVCVIVTGTGDYSGVIREVALPGGSVVTALKGKRHRIGFAESDSRIVTKVVGARIHMEGRAVDGGDFCSFGLWIGSFFFRVELLGGSQSKPLPHIFLAECVGPVHAGVVAGARNCDIIVLVGFNFAERVHLVNRDGEIFIEIVHTCLCGPYEIAQLETFGMGGTRGDGHIICTGAICGHGYRRSGAVGSACSRSVTGAVNRDSAHKSAAIDTRDLNLSNSRAVLELEHQEGVHVLKGHAVVGCDLCNGDITGGKGAGLLGSDGDIYR